MVSDTASAEYLDFVADPPALRRIMHSGEAPKPDDLVGAEFRGTNLGPAARLLGIRRFVKGFERTGQGAVLGYNRRVRGADLRTPWQPSRFRGAERFGFFTVTEVDPEAVDNRYLNALLLDYGAGPNPPRDVSRLLRDYIVTVPGTALILGHAFAALGRRRVSLGYFLLERLDG